MVAALPEDHPTAEARDQIRAIAQLRSVLAQVRLRGWGSVHAPGCPKCPNTQQLCAPGLLMLLLSVKKQCTPPNAGKPGGDDRFSFPGPGAGKRHRVLTGEATNWLVTGSAPAQLLQQMSLLGTSSSLCRGTVSQSSSSCQTLSPWHSSPAELGLTFCDPFSLC